MHTLDKSLRSALENTILAARSAAEEAAQIVLEALGVGEKVPFPHLNDAERTLRKKLRSHGRQMGDIQYEEGKQTIYALTEEVAYQHWHRMLFARFLAENDLLMDDDPVSPISLTIEECNDLAPSLGARNGWELAARYASSMLPQIFLNDSPIFSLEFPIERQKVLEQLVSSIPQEVFHASDSLGWVYQFWQTKRKKDINDSGVKIGARELPAVTQLFTEPYMVSFLLDNSLGAWWAAKRLSSHDLATATDEQELRDKAYVDYLPLEYLRFVKDEETESWKLAGGIFDAWPKHLSEFKMLDPCCGSGHFLVATLQMLVPMRMELEGLTADEAIQRVLEENIHGLELDQRCVELAAFALAFAAWTYPGSSGYRQLPPLHIACSGQAIHISDDELRKLANGNHELYYALEDLRDKFEQAPILGSLINPKSSIHQNELFSLDWEEVGPLLDSVLRRGQDDELDEAGIVAQGLAKAASLLAGTYHLVATNVPYLGLSKQDSKLRDYLEKFYNDSMNDLGTVFLDRCLQLCIKGGCSALVLPQNWLFLSRYEAFRKKMIKNSHIHLITRLGPGAFETISGEVVKPILSLIENNDVWMNSDIPNDNNVPEVSIYSIDVSRERTIQEKSISIINCILESVLQNQQYYNDKSIIETKDLSDRNRIGQFAYVRGGITTGDSPKFRRGFWEITDFYSYSYQQSTMNNGALFSGRDLCILWENGQGTLNWCAENAGATIAGRDVWGKKGIALTYAGTIHATLYSGNLFENVICVLIPINDEWLPAFWAFCASENFVKAVRSINQSFSVAVRYFEKAPIDFEYWLRKSSILFPNGLPLPFTDDPTQWIFHGHPCKSVVWDEDAKWTGFGPIRFDSTVLHVAVARLLGYRWPAELDPKMELAKEQRALVSECEALLPLADRDGIVCIPSVGGEFSASERLLKMLKASYGDAWTDDTLSTLLRNTDAPGKTLENWLRDKFFIQHCKLFGDRPFIWHVWDGLPDGFSALVNYHKLDYKKLETLIYSYLGDWIQRQKTDVASNVEGARERFSAAQALSQRLELILKGEKPYDIFVRWKSLEEQPIGWNPDLNDGARLNIRPFMSVPDIGKKDAGVLRDKPNIKWTKDRGQDVETAPWYNLGPLYDGQKGDRINDHHLSLEEKKNSRRIK